MAVFTYVAKNKQGVTEKGTMEVNNKEAFLNELRNKGLYCVSYKESGEKIEAKTAKIPLKELVIICRQFATMLDAGVSLIKCIDILYQQNDDPKIKSIMLNIYEDVQKGNALSASLKGQGKAFPNLFISMVECGEESGTLDTTLVRMADHYEKENKLNNKVKNAMIYPLVLGVVSIGVILLLLLFVVPTFADMFSEYGDLPAVTQFLMDISTFITENGILTLAVTIL
ncbi:MAG: type II secretion system F family protein, partial [Cellulosilyticaceae bacterium]